MSTRSDLWRQTTEKPARHSLKIVEASTSPFGAAASARIRSTRNADRPSAAAVSPKTTSRSVTASRRPATAGPRKNARLSIVLATAFAAVSSLGVRASVGVSAAWAERNGAFAIVAAIARA
jgi:hypothetical protein